MAIVLTLLLAAAVFYCYCSRTSVMRHVSERAQFAKLQQLCTCSSDYLPAASPSRIASAQVQLAAAATAARAAAVAPPTASRQPQSMLQTCYLAVYSANRAHCELPIICKRVQPASSYTFIK
jgi:hypothetical protein